jgi:hypothetical protein
MSKVYCTDCKHYRPEQHHYLKGSRKVATRPPCCNADHGQYDDTPVARVRVRNPHRLNAKNNCGFFEEGEHEQPDPHYKVAVCMLLVIISIAVNFMIYFWRTA